MKKTIISTLTVFLLFICLKTLPINIANPAEAQDCMPTPTPCQEDTPGWCYVCCDSYWDPNICACAPTSPIMIDLNNNGYQLTDASNGVRFDLAGDGDPHQWSWTANRSDDAFLSLDRNNDGKISSGKELFGNMTDQPSVPKKNGFKALSVFDDNNDRWIDTLDTIYQKLLLWVDKNHDGISQPSELIYLKDSKVEGIGLEYKTSRRSDRYGNKFRYKAPLRGQGLPPWCWDIFLMAEPQA